MKKRIYFFLFIFFITGLFNSSLFASGKKEPVWTLSPYEGYASSDYIVTIGSGKTEKDASNSAVAEIGKVLQQSIVATDRVHSSFTKTSETVDYSSNITLSTSLKDISGITVTDQWTSSIGTCYARAVLDRTKTGKIYVTKIRTLSEEIDDLLNSAAIQKHTFKGCQSVLGAYKKALQNDIYLELLGSIKPEYKSVVKEGLLYDSSAAVKAIVDQFIKNISISINLTGDINNQITTAFKKVITGNGISVSEDNDSNNVPYEISGTIVFEPAARNDSSYYFSRYSLSVSLDDVLTKETILQYNTHGRQGKLSQEEADQSAVRTLEKKVESEFNKKFLELF